MEPRSSDLGGLLTEQSSGRTKICQARQVIWTHRRSCRTWTPAGRKFGALAAWVGGFICTTAIGMAIKYWLRLFSMPGRAAAPLLVRYRLLLSCNGTAINTAVGLRHLLQLVVLDVLQQGIIQPLTPDSTRASRCKICGAPGSKRARRQTERPMQRAHGRGRRSKGAMAGC